MSVSTDRSANVFVAGHRGMVGSTIVRRLKSLGYANIVTRSRDDLDLLDQGAVRKFFRDTPVDQVYLATAKVGGIHANNEYPAEFINENLMVEANLIQAAHEANVQKLLFLGSSCIYPRNAHQPMPEEALPNGSLEPTNEPYVIAQIAGIFLCESFNRQYGRDYRSVMPTNLYGPGDDFHPENSHVIPTLMRRINEAREQGADEVVIWGSGKPRREFLHVNDMAAASIFVMELDSQIHAAHTTPMLSHINVGSGEDCTIRELAETISRVVGFAGELRFDVSKPDGTPRKLLDVGRLRSLGWAASIRLTAGLKETFDWYLEHAAEVRLETPERIDSEQVADRPRMVCGRFLQQQGHLFRVKPSLRDGMCCSIFPHQYSSESRFNASALRRGSS